ncbi:MAG: preprotein translocase subunit SecG [Henriciella sp.]|nr:preprotein translocase subunit SecG [Henriciella sp.]
MINVLLVIQILVAVVLVIVVLMQRSEGGALGIGGGGGGGAGGGLMSGRGVAGALVRTTIIFGAIFFATSLTLTILASKNDRGGITELEENLDNEFGGTSADDGLGIEGFGGGRDPNLDIDLSDDPLAVTPSTPVTTPETPTTENPSDDPLADPR